MELGKGGLPDVTFVLYFIFIFILFIKLKTINVKEKLTS